MNDITKKGFERWGWERPGEAGSLENGAEKGSIVGNLLDSEKRVKDSLNNVTKLEENVVEADKNPIEKKTVDVSGRQVIEYQNGTKVIQDETKGLQEIVSSDGGWSQYSKESGEWKKIDEGRYQEVTTESGDKYSQIDHVKDGKIIKTTRIYEHGKIVEDVMGGNKVTPEDLQKIDMPQIKNEVEKEEIKNEEYSDGGEIVDEDAEEKVPYGEIIDQPVEKGPAEMPPVETVQEVKQPEGEVSEKLDDGSVKLETGEEKAEIKQEIEGVKEDEITGKVDSGLTEMAKDLPQVEQKIDTVANQSVAVEEGKFERVEMQNLPEQTERPLTLEEKQKIFLEETINGLSYLDINNVSREQNGLVIDSIQVSIEGAGELNLSESQKQNLYRTVDLLRYPTDETLGKYQFNDEVDRKNVADLVRIKNPSLADKILQEGKLATNNKAEKTSFDAGQNGIDSTKEFDPIQGNVEIYMRNNGLKPDNCYVLPDGTWMVNGKNLGSRVFYDETGLQQVGVSYDDFVKYYNK